jgi:succinate dehydrogenase hydrophobic anchor subunit
VSERTLVRAQAGSGLVFALFLIAHLVNTLLAPFGAASYDGVQGAMRAVYQEPWVELGLLFGSLLVHVGCGAARARRRPKGRGGANRWQRRSGWLLVVIVFGHSLATRGASLVYDVWPGFEGIAFSLHWLPGFFYPYYLLFCLAAAYHGGLGIVRALRIFGGRRLGGRRLGGRRAHGRLGWLALLLFAVALLVALLAFGGVLFEVADPLNNAYARLYTGAGT